MRNRPRTVWALIKETLRHDAVAKAYNKLHDAMIATADAEGDFYTASAMYRYYAGIVEGLNPVHDWWGYAEAKQKLHDYEEQMEVYEARITACMEAAKSRKETYDRLRGVVTPVVDNTGEQHES